MLLLVGSSKRNITHNGDFLDARLRHSSSFIYMSIWSSQLSLQDGFRWKIGERTSISVLRDLWLRYVHNPRLQTPINVELENLKVCDLFAPNSLECDVELLE